MQFSPSNKIYAQALEKLRTLTGRYATVKTREVDQLASEIAATLKEVAEQTNGPTLKYKEIEFGEVPSSFQMNQFLESLGNDINVILDEMNILKAASVHTHNFIKTEILKSEAENERLHNKIKSLQLYSANEDASIIYAGDYFYNDEYIDWELIPTSSRIEVIRGDQISLGISNQIQLLDSGANITIEEGSNGFIGNNQEIIEPTSGASVSSVFFKEEGVTVPVSTRLKYLVDQQPNTSLEFEKYWVSDTDRNKALNYNFEYKLTGSTYTAYLNGLGDQEGNVNWANDDGDLVLNFVVDLGEINTLNLIKFTPYGLTDNKNAPILIKSVSVSSNKSDWIVLTPENVWVANGIDQNSINLEGENIVINAANFRVDAELVRYIRFELLQPTSLQANIGHFYYNDPDEEVENEEDRQRFEGPIPPVDNIWREKDPSASYQNDLVQRREKFIGRRWAIGIRDISAFSTQYNETSYMISKRFYVPGGVDRIAIEADVELPVSFPKDTAWVRFYVSPDDGNTWHQISRIQDDFLNIPEIIAYNDNTPVDLRLPGIKYVETADTPKHLRVKIEMDRPTGDNTLTPVVKSYNLKIKQRVVK